MYLGLIRLLRAALVADEPARVIVVVALEARPVAAAHLHRGRGGQRLAVTMQTQRGKR